MLELRQQTSTEMTVCSKRDFGNCVKVCNKFVGVNYKGISLVHKTAVTELSFYQKAQTSLCVLE